MRIKKKTKRIHSVLRPLLYKGLSKMIVINIFPRDHLSLYKHGPYNITTAATCTCITGHLQYSIVYMEQSTCNNHVIIVIVIIVGVIIIIIIIINRGQPVLSLSSILLNLMATELGSSRLCPSLTPL